MGAEVDFAVFWWWAGGLGAAFIVVYVAAYLLRKRINRATAPLWQRAWVARQLRSLRKVTRSRPRNGAGHE